VNLNEIHGLKLFKKEKGIRKNYVSAKKL